MLRNQLLSELNKVLQPHLIKDYCPNGLQVEGRSEIKHIVTGVTASQALIDKAIELKADAILVHHGYFWKNEDYSIVGIKKRRIAALLKNDLNLFAYHLPLDVHPVYGNNAQLGKLLDLKGIKALDDIQPNGIVMQGELNKAMSPQAFQTHLKKVLGREIVAVSNRSSIQHVAWCTGGGQSFIEQVATAANQQNSIDAFISGEISEQTTHSSRELDIDFYAAGHHATERYGVKSLGEYLATEFNLKVTFVDIDNPA